MSCLLGWCWLRCGAERLVLATAAIVLGIGRGVAGFLAEE